MVSFETEALDLAMMRQALAQAERAAAMGETPIGAVLCVGDRVLYAAHNRREIDHDISAHAEILALKGASAQKGDWRLSEATLYVTLEPCAMCAGAILASRVGRVVFGAKDAVAGAMGSVVNLPRYPLGSRPQVTSGVLEQECRALLQDFFKKRR